MIHDIGFGAIATPRSSLHPRNGSSSPRDSMPALRLYATSYL
ncbi:MAG: hypothetical protein AB4042_13130 [Leptolyngbyaceae cyanobacterium]